jgi:hypothetical protein
MAAKALRPLPHPHKELAHETRGSIDPGVLHSLDLIEAETLMLQIMHGRATVQLFLMHSNAFDTDEYLRTVARAS